MQKAEILNLTINIFPVQQKGDGKSGKGTLIRMYIFIYLKRATFFSTPWLVCI